MDSKSLARLKRGHSQRHSKKHPPPQTSSSFTVGASTSNNLPSNWDRYGEERDLGRDSSSLDVSKTRPIEVVLPKSKGADYAYLISEAKSQQQTSIRSETFPYFDDAASDFGQGIGSLVSIRGQSLLSWIEADSFVVDAESTASKEASILSLDLRALAKGLEKVDIVKRLFVEDDPFLSKLCYEELQESKSSSHGGATVGNGAAKKDQDELPDSNEGIMQQPNSKASGKEISKTNDTQPSVGAESAEAGLDMLIESFSEKKTQDFPGYIDKLSKTSNEWSLSHFREGGVPLQFDDTLDDLLKETSNLMVGENGISLINEATAKSQAIQNSEENQTRHGNKAAQKDSIEVQSPANLLLKKSINQAEVELDSLHDLSNDTRTFASHASIATSRFTSSSTKGGNLTPSYQLVPTCPVVGGPNLDASSSAADLDVLLKETSSLVSDRNRKIKHPYTDCVSPTSPQAATKSKVLDDFDLWLDTI